MAWCNSDLPKCYCTNLCVDHLEDLIRECSSGQVHADGCGPCLTCAKALGEPCGGKFNVLGHCASGLVCQIEISDEKRTAAERRAEEQSGSGVCSDRNPRCPRSGVTPSEANRNVFCRPGRLGILVEALHCPARRQTCRQRSRPTTTKPPKRAPPPLLAILGFEWTMKQLSYHKK